MEVFRTRWGYAFFAALIAGLFVFAWPFFMILIGNAFSFRYLWDQLLNSLPWMAYGMGIAAVTASLCWPKNNVPTRKRMISSGIIIPAIVILILGMTYGGLNPGFPDAMGYGEAPTLDDIFGVGLILFFVFSLLTFATPYLVGIIISLCFVEPLHS